MNQDQVEVIDSTELAKRLNVPETWVALADQCETHERSDPAFAARTLRTLSLGQFRTSRLAGSPVG